MALDNARFLITGGCGQIGLAITRYIKTCRPNSEIHILDLQISSPASEGSGMLPILDKGISEPMEGSASQTQVCISDLGNISKMTRVAIYVYIREPP